MGTQFHSNLHSLHFIHFILPPFVSESCKLVLEESEFLSDWEMADDLKAQFLNFLVKLRSSCYS